MSESSTVDGRRARPARAVVVGNIVLAVVGGAALVVALGYGPLGEGGRIGPGFLPAVAGGLVLVFALVEIAKLYLARPTPAPTSSLLAQVAQVEDEAAEAADRPHHEELDTFGRTGRQQKLAIVKVFASIAVAVAAVPLVGLLLSAGLLVVALTVWVERRPVVPAVLTATGAVVLAHVLFVQLLRVPVPTGALGLL